MPINLKSGKHGLANGLSANKDNVSEGVQAVYDSTSTQKVQLNLSLKI